MGLAVADDASGVTSPLAVVSYAGIERAVAEIARRAAELGAGRVVLGAPLAVDGSRTPACRRSEQLAAALEAAGIDVVLQGEYLTSNEARRRARDAGRPGTRPVDDLAAQVMLEEHLDSEAAGGKGGRER